MKKLALFTWIAPLILNAQILSVELGGMANNLSDPDDQVYGNWWKIGPTGGAEIEFGHSLALGIGARYANKGASFLYDEEITHLFDDTVVTRSRVSGKYNFTYATLPILFKVRFDVGPEPVIPYDPLYQKTAIRLILGGYGGYMIGGKYMSSKVAQKVTIYSQGKVYEFTDMEKARKDFQLFQDLFEDADSTRDLSKPITYPDNKERNSFKPYDAGIIAGMEFFNQINKATSITVGIRAEVGMININNYFFSKVSYDDQGRLVLDPYKISTQALTVYFQYGFRLGR